jgi:hypothetical protein
LCGVNKVLAEMDADKIEVLDPGIPARLIADTVDKGEAGRDESFIYEKAVSCETYDRQQDKLNEQIVLAEMQEREAKLKSYDVEAVLNFVEHVILNAARLWTELASDAKQRLQRVLFRRASVLRMGFTKPQKHACFSSCYRNPKAKKLVWRPYRESKTDSAFSKNARKRQYTLQIKG